MLGMFPGAAAPAPQQPPAAAPAPAAPVQQPGGDPKKTMLGFAPAVAAPAQQQAPMQAAAAKRTMVGMPQVPGAPGQPFAAPAQQPPQPPQQAQAPQQPWPQQAQAPQQPWPQQAQATSPQVADPKRTMLGMAAPAGFQPAPQAPQPQQHPQSAAAAQPPQPAPASPAQPARPPSAQRTMLGVAIPGIAPVQPGSQPPAAAVAVQPARAPSAQRTMLGVAMPGIAPVSPGSAPPAPPREPWGPAYQPVAPAPPPPFAPQAAPRPRSEPRASSGLRALAILLAVLGVLIALGIGLFALLWKSPPPLKAEAKIDPKGQDMLQLSCGNCPDGTVVEIGGVKGTVRAGVAEISLAKPLAVGENRFSVQIDRPGAGRDETVGLVVPIAYRVYPDLSALGAARPMLQIAVEAAPGTAATVDGKPVTLGADGKGVFPIDLTADCSGESAEVSTIERQVPYTIARKGGGTDTGKAVVKVPVAPLTLEAPRGPTVIDSPNLLVAGRTSKSASVDIEGAQLAAGADGAFARKLRVDAMGSTQVRVRAQSRDHAPRMVTFTVKRVADLEAEAKSFAAEAKLTLPALLAGIAAHAGEPIVLSGEVLDARVQGYQTIALLDAHNGCTAPPCLVRLVRGGTDPVAKGEKVRVFGRVRGPYEAPGSKTVAEVDVGFLLRGGRGAP
jgi:hypothetical protein